MKQIFYTSIANYYEHIFPANPAQIEFLRKVLPYNGAKILDVGCAIGDLTYALNQFGFPVWAFDSDNKMVEIALQKKPEEAIFPVFQQLDMKLIDEHYPEDFFDTIICFGNTLVHLLNDDDILKFLNAAYKVLLPGGKLTIQILNYSNILSNKIQSLPLIENDKIKFERFYEFNGDSDLIDFITKLTIKADGNIINNKLPLYAIEKEKLDNLVASAGFIELEYFGSFKHEPLTDSSLPLIIVCKKPESK